jgi:hypothetical protein
MGEGVNMGEAYFADCLWDQGNDGSVSLTCSMSLNGIVFPEASLNEKILCSNSPMSWDYDEMILVHSLLKKPWIYQ